MTSSRCARCGVSRWFSPVPLPFFAPYLWMGWQIGRRLVSDVPANPRTFQQTWTPFAVMILLGVVLIGLAGPEWGGLFIYTSAIAAADLPVKRSAWVVGGLALFAVVGLLASHQGGGAALSALFTILVTGFTTTAMRWAFLTNRELRHARQELAQMAVTNERLRFARDLHDLLGHTLSLIALKSELAGRLARVAPERAAVEMADVEAAARQALHEVREAVAGYRQPTFAGELRAAREMLDAAGIALSLDAPEPPFPLRPTVEGMLAWTVREGVTNVIRHSRARACSISVSYGDDAVSLTVSDDGLSKDGAAVAPGNGLRGMAERAVALEGTCEAAWQESGGFRLRVTLPLDAMRRHASVAPVGKEMR